MSDLETRLQGAIESLYRVDGPHSVADFRIDKESLERLLGSDRDRSDREALVVAQAGDETLLAVFICDRILEKARRFDVRVATDGEAAPHLDAFCVATEGVSHFLYFTFAGDRQDRPVSQIELELQAEIDKFLLLRLVCGLSGAAMIDALFHRFEMDARLSDDQRERYHVANRAARRYARWLDRRLGRGETGQALSDARALYRKPLSGKLEQIERAAA